MSENNTTLIDEFGRISSLIHIILLAVAMFSLAFLTVLGNTIVIYALRTNRHLRTVIFMIFLSVYLNLLR
jgi:TRAP-type mannitol/chloroaromatic compound transport system permease large subunit